MLLGCNRPSERDLNNHVIPEVADRWRKIGVELLDDDSVKELDIIENDRSNVCYNLICKGIYICKWMASIGWIVSI